MSAVRIFAIFLTSALACAGANAQDVLASATIRVGETIPAEALAPAPLAIGADASEQERLDRLEDARRRIDALKGLEAARTIYAGRLVHDTDVRKPTLVERNDLVRMTYRLGGLVIETEGRAMERGGLGDSIRVMNLSSRQAVTARVSGMEAVLIEGART